MLDLVAGILMVAGGLFGLVGGIGLLRFPDFFTRQHAGGISDTLCALLVVLGLVVAAGWSLLTLKLLLILLFLLFTAPTATHALARAAVADGIQPVTSKRDDDESDTVGKDGESPSKP